MLIVYANLLAVQEEHRVSIWNPAFHQYSRYFASTVQVWPPFDRFVFKLVYYKARMIDRLKLSNSLFSTRHLDWNDRLDLDQVDVKTLPQICFIQGWQVRANRLLQKHAAAIRTFFRPAEKFDHALNDFWKKNVREGETVVGIHVRRGDYDTFEKGAYYYSLEQYQALMQQLQALFGTEQITFLVASADKLSRGDFNDPSLRIIFAPGHELLDLYALSRCHYIAGPPSTYSMWASFYGIVPLYLVREPHRQIQKKDFSVQSHF
jgi:hypothetical protein